jgi:hypothetical protein
MLAPLLLGTGMLLRSIKANAAYIIPRVGLLFVLLWVCWFAHSVVQRTLLYMQQQVRTPPQQTNKVAARVFVCQVAARVGGRGLGAGLGYARRLRLHPRPIAAAGLNANLKPNPMGYQMDADRTSYSAYNPNPIS